MQDLGETLPPFRDDTLTDLRPFLTEWLQDGALSVPRAGVRGVGTGLSIWWEGESDFWGGGSTYAIEMANASANFVQEYLESKTTSERLRLLNPITGAPIIFGDIAEYVLDQIVEAFSDVEDLTEFMSLIANALKAFGSGVVNTIEAALDSLQDLPGELGELFRLAKQNSQDWIEAMSLVASETNAFEYIFSLLGTIFMSMTPNFWAEMIGIAGGFLLPELIIELIIMVIVAFTGGSAAPAMAGRAALFIARLRKLGKAVKSANILTDVVTAFRRICTVVARMGTALRKLLDDAAQAAAGGVARIRRNLNQWTFEIDPNTLGMNGGNIRIVRKALGKQIPYGSSRLSRRAQEYRRANNLTGKNNVAVFEYVDEAGNVQTIARNSERGVGHAERIIARELEAKGIPSENIRSIYSELAPCNAPGGYCERMIRNTFPDAAVTYSFEYGDGASRRRGVEALGDAVSDLFSD